MKCKICGSEHVEVIYDDEIRIGGLGKYTNQPVPMYQCRDCGVIWHEKVVEDLENYYESTEYRASLNEASEDIFYDLHDKETLNKLEYTKTDVFRNKIVADIGCGAGSFLDMIKGMAKTAIAIEPSEMFRNALKRKGFITYPYTQDSFDQWGGKVDVATSFDVIEHVEDPISFLQDIYDLLSTGGQTIIGTPTETPVMRQILGKIYEKQVLFTVQHLWLFSEKSLRRMAEKVGFKNIRIKFFQNHGIDNLIGWCVSKKPNPICGAQIFSGGGLMDSAWRSACSELRQGDYVVLYADK